MKYCSWAHGLLQDILFFLALIFLSACNNDIVSTDELNFKEDNMIPIFESDHDWTGNPAPETARFSYTFHPQNTFMSFYDYAIDIMESFELVQNQNQSQSISLILRKPGLATLLTSDAMDIIVDFHFNESLPEIADSAWVHVAEGVIAFNSGKVHVDGGSEVEVGIILDPGNYAFRVYFGEIVGPIESNPNEWYQKLALYFRKTEAEETNEIKVLKDGTFQQLLVTK